MVIAPFSPFLYSIELFISSGLIEYLYFNKNIKLYNYRHFSLYLKYTEYDKAINNINKYISNKNNTYYSLRGSETYFFRIVNNQDITYYDLLNKGNYGYNGDSKISSRINSLDSGSIFIVDDSLCTKESNNHFICDSLKYLVIVKR